MFLLSCQILFIGSITLFPLPETCAWAGLINPKLLLKSAIYSEVFKGLLAYDKVMILTIVPSEPPEASVDDSYT